MYIGPLCHVSTCEIVVLCWTDCSTYSKLVHRKLIKYSLLDSTLANYITGSRFYTSVDITGLFYFIKSHIMTISTE